MGKGSPSPGEVQPQGWKASSETQPPLVSHATKNTQSRHSWLRADVETLLRLKSEGESWDTIGKLIPGHNVEQCISKWNKRNRGLKTKTTEGAWSKAEDQFLCSLSREDQDWEAISQKIGRSARACKVRFDEYFTGISDDVRWPWTHNEERLLVALWQQGVPFETISLYFKDRTGGFCQARWARKLKFQPEKYAAWSPEEDRRLLSFSSIPVARGSMLNHFTINGRRIRRTPTECKRGKAELENPATKSVSVLKTSTSVASRTAKSKIWTEHDKKQLVHFCEAGKTWYEICLLLLGDHTAMDCRNYWLEHYWDSFHKLMPNGQLDIAELERLGWKAGENTMVEEEEDKEEMEGMVEYDDEVDAAGDTDEDVADAT